MAFFIESGRLFFLGVSGKDGVSAYVPQWVPSKWGMLLVTGPNVFPMVEATIARVVNQGYPEHNQPNDMLIFNKKKGIMTYANRLGQLVHIPREAISAMGLLISCSNLQVELIINAVAYHFKSHDLAFDAGVVYRALASTNLVGGYRDAFLDNQFGIKVEDLFDSAQAVPIPTDESYNPFPSVQRQVPPEVDLRDNSNAFVNRLPSVAEQRYAGQLAQVDRQFGASRRMSTQFTAHRGQFFTRDDTNNTFQRPMQPISPGNAAPDQNP